jgi:hypothetical protein
MSIIGSYDEASYLHRMNAGGLRAALRSTAQSRTADKATSTSTMSIPKSNSHIVRAKKKKNTTRNYMIIHISRNMLMGVGTL